MNKRITIRDLQKISTEAIAALDGATPITSGDTTVAILMPLKMANKERLRKVVSRAAAWAKGRNAAADDAALATSGPVDKTNWSAATVKDLRRKKNRKK